MIGIIFIFFFLDMFDTIGTLVGVGGQAGLMRDGRLPPALWLGGALAVVGLAGGGYALASGGDQAVDPASRVGAIVEAMSTKAASECREAMAREKAEQAEAAVQEAERRAAAAEKGREERDEPDKPTTTHPKPKGKDPHGGVDGPGF